MLLKNVRCKWASVIEPNTKFDHRWEVLAILTDKQSAVLADHGFKLSTEEDGTSSYRFRRKVEGSKKDGTKYEKTAPNVVDAENQPFGKLIGNGSLINIQYNVKTTNMLGNTYITGDLLGVQVIEHVAFGDDSEFGSEGFTSEIPDTNSNSIEEDAAAEDKSPF